MGRWLKMIENFSETELTKPTKPGYVSFYSDNSANLFENSRANILMSFVRDCCIGLGVEPYEVINRLISNEDEEDLLMGVIPKSVLILHIQLWLSNGKPTYSGKKNRVDSNI
ncbi:TPA: hypothetical protein I8034_000850 [Legionella pneumophila]|nr:hypothetical protein [Legionella pneumophila subsp. fraseri]HAT1771504.1 hypothetical protein [Legionella pneumophila]MDX1845553.1 hypothetical protein [Legionella pneumophila subsp. fraseri]HAT2126348.1 hypothetical protein [Legionella pneumophila]HAT2135412.1 hypothetical protein [Legionella pneumophila]